MIESFELIASPLFGLAATLYLWLAVRLSRDSSNSENNAISYFLFLIGAGVAGAAFAHAGTDPQMYAIGRVLSLFSAGFLPIAIYCIYRRYTSRPPSSAVLAALAIVPATTTLLAITNPLHHLIWATIEVDTTVRFARSDQPFWFNNVFTPYSFGLFGYSVVALAGRLPTIALAHRNKIGLFLLCALLPYAVSFANNVLKIGPSNFPFTVSALVLMLPLYWWASVKMRVHEFSPLAYQKMFDHVRDPIIVLDKSQRIISANLPAQQLLEARESDLVGDRLWEDLPEAQAILDHARDRNVTQTVRMRSDRYYELNSAPLVGNSGRSQGTVVVCRDVTERKKALRALADSEHLIRSLVEHSSNGMLRFARDESESTIKYRCTFANRAAERFLQSEGSALVGMPLEKLESLEPHQLIAGFGDGDRLHSTVSYELHADVGESGAWLRIVAEPVGHDFSVTLIDITQRKRNEDKILADALRDPLTGALNRRGLERHGVEAVESEPRGAVLYLDLNRFKAINDRFGHQAGDALLKAFGKRLEFCLRPEDVLARLGGDEFAVILPGVSIDEAQHIAGRLVESASEAYLIHGEEILCAAAIGIALYPAHGSELWQLIAAADKAMYHDKAADADTTSAGKVAQLASAS